MGFVRRDRKPKAATVWANQLDKRYKNITIVSGRADGTPFRIAIENQHKREPNGLIIKKVAVMLGFDPAVKITGLEIQERLLLMEWTIGRDQNAETQEG